MDKRNAVKALIDEGRSVSDISYILGIPEKEVLNLMVQKKHLNFDDFRKEKERRETMTMFKKAWDENKEAIVAISSIVLGGSVKLIHGFVKKSNLKKEASNKELYCYDRSLGHYWKLKRRLTNAEWVEIDKRKKNGERLADILDALKVLD